MLFRLDIPVNDAGGMDGGQPGGHLLEDGKSFPGRYRRSPAQPRCEGFARQQLHSQEQKAWRRLVAMKDVINGAEI